MALFGVMTENNDKTDQFFKDMEVKFREDNLIKNPFKARVKKSKRGFHVISMTPLYPNFSLYAWLGAFALVFIAGWTPWVFIPVLFGMTGIFWSSYFFFFMAKLGLRKKGYDGPVVYMKNKEIVSKTFFGGKA